MIQSLALPKGTDTLVLASAMTGSFLAGMANRIFNVSLPTFAEALETDILGMSWTLISYQLATTSLAVVFGRIGDLYGRDRIYIAGFGVMTLSVFLCGTSTGVSQVVIYRTLKGLGAAMIQSTSRVLAMQALPPGAEGRANGFMTTAFQTGFIVGPPLGGLMVEWVSWRGICFVMVPIGVSGFVLTILNLGRGFPHHEGRRDATLDRVGVLLFVPAVILLVLLIDTRTSGELLRRWSFLPWFGFIGIATAFVLRQQRSRDPIVDFGLFRNRMFGFSSAALYFASMTYAIHDLVMPFYLQDVLRMTPSQIGLLFMASPVVVVALSPLAGTLTDRAGPRLPGTCGVVSMTSAYLLATQLTASTHWSVPATVITLTGVGLALFNTPNHAAIIGSAPEGERGLAAGMIQTMFGLAHLVGVSAGSSLLRLLYDHSVEGQNSVPDPLNHPAEFVGAVRGLFWVCVSLGVIACICSVLRGGKRLTTTSHSPRSSSPKPIGREQEA